MKIHNFLIILPLVFLTGASLRAQPANESHIDSLFTPLPAKPQNALKGPSDSLLSLIKSFPTAQVLIDSLWTVRNSFSSDHSEAYFDAFDAGIEYYTSINKDTAVAHLVFEKSHLYMLLSQYPKALLSFRKALALYQALSYTEQIGMCYYNIAWIHQKQNNVARFLEYSKLSYQYCKDIPENNNTCLAIMTLAIAYHGNDSLDQSLQYLLAYNSMAKRVQDPNHMAQALGKLGTFYLNSTMDAALDSARKYYKLEWKTAQKDSSGRPLLMAGIDMGSLEKKDENYDRALYYYQIAHTTAEHNKRQYETLWIESAMAETYALAGHYDKAYDTYRSYTHSKDSVFSEKKNLQVAELEKKYETAKKDQQIALLTKEKEIQHLETERQATWKRTLLGGLLLITIIAGLLIYTLRQRLRSQKLVATKNEEIKQANFKQQLSELEMKALRAQMNPHFIFNCINSINRMVLSGEGSGASRYLGKFAKLIRLMLENSENPTVTLEDELVMLEAYLQLESLRFKEKIRYQIVVDATIDRETTCLPAMVLQPFIENAIWHGLMPKEGDGLIKVTIQEEEDVLKCIIEDNGVGRERALAASQVTKKKSMGLQITEERLKLLSKERLKELIRITDLKDSMNRALGTRVDVLIPIS